MVGRSEREQRVSIRIGNGRNGVPFTPVGCRGYAQVAQAAKECMRMIS